MVWLPLSENSKTNNTGDLFPIKKLAHKNTPNENFFAEKMTPEGESPTLSAAVKFRSKNALTMQVRHSFFDIRYRLLAKNLSATTIYSFLIFCVVCFFLEQALQ